MKKDEQTKDSRVEPAAALRPSERRILDAIKDEPVSAAQVRAPYNTMRRLVEKGLLQDAGVDGNGTRRFRRAD